MAKKKQKTERSRGQIIPKGEGKYLIRYYVGVDQAGRRKYSSRTVKGNYRQAERELTRSLREIDTGTFVEPARQTLTEYLAQWLESSVRLTVSPRTYEDYCSRLRRDVIPRIGHRRLDQLNRPGFGGGSHP